MGGDDPLMPTVLSAKLRAVSGGRLIKEFEVLGTSETSTSVVGDVQR